MRTSVFYFTMGMSLVGSLLVVACVGDTPSTGPSGSAQDDAAADTSTSVPPAGDASSTTSDAGNGDTKDSSTGAPVCSFAPTPFPCPGANARACYGSSQSCSLTGCSGSDDRVWSCFSPNQCSSLPCCLAAADATLHPSATCTQGALVTTPDANAGASCVTTTTCAAGDTQLCQFNSQCPAGQFCGVVKVVSMGDGGAASINTAILGACMPL